MTAFKDIKVNVEAIKVKLKIHNHLQQNKLKNFVLLNFIAVLYITYTYINKIKNIKNKFDSKEPMLYLNINEKNFEQALCKDDIYEVNEKLMNSNIYIKKIYTKTNIVTSDKLTGMYLHLENQNETNTINFENKKIQYTNEAISFYVYSKRNLKIIHCKRDKFRRHGFINSTMKVNEFNSNKSRNSSNFNF